MSSVLPSKPLLFGLLAASLVAGAWRSRACQYCRLAATDPEAARMAAQMHAGGFPLDATINQFQAAAPPAALTAPPAPDRIATSAADLPAASRLAATAPKAAAPAKPTVAPGASVGSVPPPREAATIHPPPAGATRWADAGLLGLLSAGGWFCWRTRRVSAPVG